MTSAQLVEHLESALNQGPFPEPLRGAMLVVDRARFVRPCDAAFAYEDRPLPLDTALGSARPVSELRSTGRGATRSLRQTLRFRAPRSAPR
jgi:protein-L-isoaspartate O-methyltransferase